MGRELKRVPLDFNQSLNEVWPGFVNNLYDKAIKCAHCAGSGYSPEAGHLHDLWYGKAPFKPEDRGSVPFTPESPPVRAFAARNVAHSPYGPGEAAIKREAERLCRLFNSRWSHHLNTGDVAALVAAHRLHDFTDVFTPGTGWAPKQPPVTPTPAEVNAWSLNGFGHDAINCWVVIEAECARLSMPTTCSYCEGEGHIWPSPSDKQAYEDWQPTPPPTGPGYQIWETVSEGSPISPVFFTARDLALHMATTSWGADKGTSVEAWLKFIEGPGWAPSMIMTDGKIMSGVEAGL